MGRRRFWFNVAVPVALCIAAVLLGPRLLCRAPVARALGIEVTQTWEFYKEVRNGVFVLSAAWIAACFQRRNNYVKTLADYWPRIVRAAQGAIQYTHAVWPPPSAPSQPLIATSSTYSAVLKELSIAIDESRGLFRNLPDVGAARGRYPLEPLKVIFEVVRHLGCEGNFNLAQRATARQLIKDCWHLIYHGLPEEFERITLPESLTVLNPNVRALQQRAAALQQPPPAVVRPG